MLPDTPDAPLQTESEPAVTPNKKRNAAIRQSAQACKTYKRKLIKDWSLSVDYRRGKPFASQSDDDRIAVNLDWSFTKMKQASLFSQVPAVRVNHPPQTLSKDVSPWLYAFEQRINDTLISSGIETAMDESLPDCINAAGIGVVMVSHEALTEQKEVPAIDLGMLPPALQQQILQTGMLPDGSPVPMDTVPDVLDHRYLVSRISPADFLWPVSFNGSDFDKAPWIGRSGRIPWAEAQNHWNLDEAQKDKYLGGERNLQDTITSDIEKDSEADEEYVEFDEIFYREHSYGKAKSYSSIHHLVFLAGKEQPIVDEPWKGQEFDKEGRLIGAQRYPIRVLSLTYITDEAIPPSDSAIGRPQVNEINKSRTQMFLQREHSLPVRWVDINRIDPTVLFNLMKGTWQGMIPVQGNGQNVIGEVSRAGMPQENHAFYQMAQQDLSLAWQVGQEHSGNKIETKGEAEVVQSNVSARIGRERAKVGSFFCSIAEVLGGLICVYEDPATIGEGFDPVVSRTLAYSILADSTVLLDSTQRLKRINDFVNMYAKSGWVDLEPVLKEAATLSGLDPVVIRPPDPRPPVEPNISLRLTGTEDLMNPLVLAVLLGAGQGPKPELIEQAKKLIEQAVVPPTAPGLMPDPNGGAPIPGQEMPSGPAGPPPSPAPPLVGDANPQMSAMSKVNQRILDREND
jgi:hypothetical protein